MFLTQPHNDADKLIFILMLCLQYMKCFFSVLNSNMPRNVGIDTSQESRKKDEESVQGGRRMETNTQVIILEIIFLII